MAKKRKKLGGVEPKDIDPIALEVRLEVCNKMPKPSHSLSCSHGVDMFSRIIKADYEGFLNTVEEVREAQIKGNGSCMRAISGASCRKGISAMVKKMIPKVKASMGAPVRKRR